MSIEKDDLWVSQHFEELVEKYGGSYVAIADERVVAWAKDEEDILAKAKEATGNGQALFMKVPREEEFPYILNTVRSAWYS